MGHICESGNGYIRFSNGIQICYGEVINVYMGHITKYSRPFLINTKPYVMMHLSNMNFRRIDSSPYVYISSDENKSNDSQLVAYIKATSLQIRSFSGLSDAILQADLVDYTENYIDVDTNHAKGVSFRYLAIGRWK